MKYFFHVKGILGEKMLFLLLLLRPFRNKMVKTNLKTFLIFIEMEQYFFYKIICNDPLITENYTGHAKDIHKRKLYHIWDSKRKGKDFKVYKFIKENGGWENWSFVEIERGEYENRKEAQKREQYWIDMNNSTLNQHRAFNYDEDWKKWYENYRKTEKYITYMENHREEANIRAKKHYENHKEEKLAYQKEYKQKNIEKILQKNKDNWHKNKHIYLQKIECICGAIICEKSKKKHETTEKHKKNLNR